MKSHRQELWFETPTRQVFINITPQVESAPHASCVREGLCLVNAMHISASVFVNDDERGLHQDFLRWPEGLAPCRRPGEQIFYGEFDGRRRKPMLVKIIGE